ncbi:glycosyltransferase family 2 protein [Mixta calida]|uniref:glycosyltransferase family 2 protein n=1 Tax=Mixta calida TaxID=665913 RepID=UPI0034D7A196
MGNLKRKVDIVLATYNGCKYIREQIDSILAMNQFDELVHKIIICDDNSKDNTLEIIREAVPSEKLLILENCHGAPFGPAKNFERGIAISKADYIMLSDQDDYWEKEKLQAYYREAMILDNNLPFIIFSDLEVVDTNLKTLAPSFLKYQSIGKNWLEHLNNLLIQNIAPGCTMMFNQELIKKSMPFPENCLMHDWWMMLVCKLYGNIKFIEGKTFIKYRQHDNNQVGAKKNDIISLFSNLSLSLNTAAKNYIRTVQQMSDFKKRYCDDIPNENKDFIDALTLIFNTATSRTMRVFKAYKVKMRKSSAIKTFGTYLIIFKGFNK